MSQRYSSYSVSTLCKHTAHLKIMLDLKKESYPNCRAGGWKNLFL